MVLEFNKIFQVLPYNLVLDKSAIHKFKIKPKANYSTLKSSTSKIKVENGGIEPACCAP